MWVTISALKKEVDVGMSSSIYHAPMFLMQLKHVKFGGVSRTISQWEFCRPTGARYSGFNERLYYEEKSFRRIERAHL
jgi:hypothetical protein